MTTDFSMGIDPITRSTPERVELADDHRLGHDTGTHALRLFVGGSATKDGRRPGQLPVSARSSGSS